MPPSVARRAVVTLAVGPAIDRMAAITHPFLRRYATRCQADFHVISGRRLEHLGLVTYEKLQLHSFLADYERILFLDTDILVAPDAPDVFQLVPIGTFGASSENYSQAGRHKSITQEVLGSIDWRQPYFNSGMMVFSNVHASMFDPRSPELLTWASGDSRQEHDLTDQPYLNYRLNQLGFDMLDLGYRFNHTRVIRETHIRFRSHIIHHSGPSGHRYGPKLHQIGKDAAVMASPLNLWLSRRFPAYRWLADRLDLNYLKYLRTERFVRDSTEVPTWRH